MTKPPWTDPELAGFLRTAPELNAQTLPALRQASKASWQDQPEDPRVWGSERQVPGPPGSPPVRVLIYRPTNAPSTLPGLLWIHGGNYVLRSADSDDLAVKELVNAVGCVVVSVDYRLAPETAFPGPTDDCYAALRWMHDQAELLGLDSSRLAVGGASSGGGLAAAVALMARDRGAVPLAYQLLIYPMLDDRSVVAVDPNPHTIKWDGLNFGWEALLGHQPGLESAPLYAAAARAIDLGQLPPAFIAVGSLDLFVDESVEYAHRLLRAGVPTELHVYPGVYHAFDVIAKEASVSKNLVRDRTAALRRALGRGRD